MRTFYSKENRQNYIHVGDLLDYLYDKAIKRAINVGDVIDRLHEIYIPPSSSPVGESIEEDSLEAENNESRPEN